MNCSTQILRISTGARLHFGLFSDERPGGRRFQGCGVMIDAPRIRLTGCISETPENSISWSGPENPPSDFDELQHRIQHTLQRFQDSQSAPLPSFHIDILELIPRHAGLGSGTQLDLAVASLAAHLVGLNQTSLELASKIGRGKRSTIGTFGFQSGGFLIDRGVAENELIGQCRFQTTLPENWRWLLATPTSISGFSGVDETNAFKQLSPLSAENLHVLEGFLKEIENHPNDFDVVSHTLTEYGNLIGDSFAAVQGGRFRDPTCARIAEAMTHTGVTGIAQSSWGPTIVGLCRNQLQADQVQQTLNNQIPEVKTRIATTLNHGYHIVPQA